MEQRRSADPIWGQLLDTGSPPCGEPRTPGNHGPNRSRLELDWLQTMHGKVASIPVDVNIRGALIVGLCVLIGAKLISATLSDELSQLQPPGHS